MELEADDPGWLSPPFPAGKEMEFHWISKHLEAAFDHNNTEFATFDLAPGIPATSNISEQKKNSVCYSVSSVSEMEAICCEPF